MPVRINPDQSLSYSSPAPGRSSLYDVMAPGNVKLVNQLMFDELLEVIVCARANPFPIDGMTASREQTVAHIRKIGAVADCFPVDHKIRRHNAGDLRLAVVAECGDSCNGPTDGWLKYLVEHRQVIEAVEATVPPMDDEPYDTSAM